MTGLPRFYVYAIFDPNGVPRYIGKGTGRRLDQHESDAVRGRHPNGRLSALILKAGGSLPKVKLRQGLTNDEACLIERAFIAALGRGSRGPLLNMTDGGEGAEGRFMSAESKALAGRNSGLARMGMKIGPMSEDRRKAISKANLGKPLSAEVCKARSVSQKGRAKSSSWRAAISSGQKRAWSERKSSAACRQ